MSELTMIDQYPAWQREIRRAQAEHDKEQEERDKALGEQFDEILNEVYGITDHDGGLTYSKDGITIRFVSGGVNRRRDYDPLYDYTIEVFPPQETEALKATLSEVTHAGDSGACARLADAIDGKHFTQLYVDENKTNEDALMAALRAFIQSLLPMNP